MTTIAYRDGVLAADSGVWRDQARMPYAQKIARAPDGTLYGVTGGAAEGSEFIRWVVAGAKDDAPKARPAKDDDNGSTFAVLKVSPDGHVELITAHGIEEWGYPPYAAIGGGAEGALCALHAGATAVAAVSATIAHTNYAVAPVQHLRFDSDGRIVIEPHPAPASPQSRTA